MEKRRFRFMQHFVFKSNTTNGNAQKNLKGGKKDDLHNIGII